ncbi:MAG TPA: hypothetical protein VMG12_39625 [Polyangiaceae bacterium]|nr:hypothetical protein [Polyangiaceae bacterium]
MLASVAAVLLAAPRDADAVNLNTSGTICNPYNAGEANDIDYVTNGVRTGPSVGSARNVICSVPRSPLASPQGFYLDGTNQAGKSTSITLYAHDFNGTFQTSQNVSSSAATYDEYRALTPVGQWSYISAFVTLPANAGGTFLGVITLQ